MEGNVLEGRILVKEKEQEKKVGSIYVISNGQREGEVVIGSEQVPVACVITYKSQGTKLKIDGEEYVLLNERDVLYMH